MKKWFKDRLKERSTYIGLSLLLGSLGIVVAPEQLEVIVVSATAIAGVVQTVKKES